MTGPADNRNYDYSSQPQSERAEYAAIADIVPSGSKLIDLGCGNGSLMAFLYKKKAVSATGIELSPTGAQSARDAGLDVSEGRIDRPLTEFHDVQFDYAICNVTLQMVQFPEILLREMGRISRYQIVSFPNFGFYRNRLDLLFRGRMPKPMLFGYNWFSTGHIHQLGYNDFIDFCRDEHFRIMEIRYGEKKRNLLGRFLQKNFPSVFAVTCIFLLEKEKAQQSVTS